MLSNIFAENGGGYAGATYQYGSDARSFSMGNSMVASQNGGFNQFANPALMARETGMNFGLSYFEMSLDRRIETLSMSIHLPPKATIGLAIFRAGTDDIQGRDNHGDFTEKFSMSDYVGIMSFSIGYTEKFSLGLNMKAYFNNIHSDYQAHGIGFDAGFLYRWSKNISIAGVAKNIASSTSWKIPHSDGTEKSYSEEFPLILSIGAQYFTPFDLLITMQSDAINTYENRFENILHFGCEYSGFSKDFDIRFGLKELTPTFGFGYNLSALNKYLSQFNYAVDFGMQGEGMSHNFSFIWKNNNSTERMQRK